MQNVNISPLVLLILLFSSSCLAPRINFFEYRDYDSSLYPKLASHEVIELHAFPRKYRYEILGTLTAEGYIIKVHPDAMVLRDMKEKAAYYGANAIVLQEGKIHEGEIDNRVNLKWYHHITPYDSPRTTTATAIRIYP